MSFWDNTTRGKSNLRRNFIEHPLSKNRSKKRIKNRVRKKPVSRKRPTTTGISSGRNYSKPGTSRSRSSPNFYDEFQCKVCGEDCYTKRLLNMHMKQKHRRKKKEGSDDDEFFTLPSVTNARSNRRPSGNLSTRYISNDSIYNNSKYTNRTRRDLSNTLSSISSTSRNNNWSTIGNVGKLSDSSSSSSSEDEFYGSNNRKKPKKRLIKNFPVPVIPLKKQANIAEPMKSYSTILSNNTNKDENVLVSTDDYTAHNNNSIPSSNKVFVYNKRFTEVNFNNEKEEEDKKDWYKEEEEGESDEYEEEEEGEEEIVVLRDGPVPEEENERIRKIIVLNELKKKCFDISVKKEMMKINEKLFFHIKKKNEEYERKIEENEKMLELSFVQSFEAHGRRIDGLKKNEEEERKKIEEREKECEAIVEEKVKLLEQSYEKISEDHKKRLEDLKINEEEKKRKIEDMESEFQNWEEKNREIKIQIDDLSVKYNNEKVEISRSLELFRCEKEKEKDDFMNQQNEKLENERNINESKISVLENEYLVFKNHIKQKNEKKKEDFENREREMNQEFEEFQARKAQEMVDLENENDRIIMEKKQKNNEIIGQLEEDLKMWEKQNIGDQKEVILEEFSKFQQEMKSKEEELTNKLILKEREFENQESLFFQKIGDLENSHRFQIEEKEGKLKEKINELDWNFKIWERENITFVKDKLMKEFDCFKKDMETKEVEMKREKEEKRNLISSMNEEEEKIREELTSLKKTERFKELEKQKDEIMKRKKEIEFLDVEIQKKNKKKENVRLNFIDLQKKVSDFEIRRKRKNEIEKETLRKERKLFQKDKDNHVSEITRLTNEMKEFEKRKERIIRETEMRKKDLRNLNLRIEEREKYETMIQQNEEILKTIVLNKGYSFKGFAETREVMEEDTEKKKKKNGEKKSKEVPYSSVKGKWYENCVGFYEIYSKELDKKKGINKFFKFKKKKKRKKLVTYNFLPHRNTIFHKENFDSEEEVKEIKMLIRKLDEVRINSSFILKKKKKEIGKEEMEEEDAE